MPRALIVLFLVFLTSCAPRSRVASPEGMVPAPEWSTGEMRQALARRQLWKRAEASHHIIRLNSDEEPHVHRTHDLTAFMLEGQARIHMEGLAVDLRKGDVVDIPRGTTHWVEKKGRKSPVVYAVFTPAFDGKDHHPV
jgi:mannose-6-phosphate isomerase-like protein (cupin superfamily)